MAEENIIIPPPSDEESSAAIATSKNLPSSGFDFANYQPIDFTPEYYEKIMRMTTGGRRIRTEGRGGSPKEQVIKFTPSKVFAIEAADQFSQMYPGFGTYKELTEGTSKLAPGLKMTDEMILKALTTMEERGFLEALGRRTVENLPAAAAFAAGAKGTKEVVDRLPRVQKTGIKPVDKLIPLYEGAKSIAPLVGGTVTSVLSSPLGQDFGDFVLGDEALPTPETYSTMRQGEAVSDVLSFSPLLLKADAIVTDSLSDYLTNRLSKDFDSAGRDFDFSDLMRQSLRKQYKEAQKKAGAVSDGLRKREGATYEGPPIVNDFFERGVAAVLQGKTAPGTLLRLHAFEQILKNSAKGATKDKKSLALFAFYEALAAGGAGLATDMAASASPFGAGETFAEIGGAVAGPMAGGELGGLVYRKILSPIGTVGRGFADAGLPGAFDAAKRRGREIRAKRGFQSILRELESFGEIDTPEQLDDLIQKLETNALSEGTPKTAGQATKSPVLLSMEDTLKRQFEFLNNQQLSAKEAELETAQRLLAALYSNKNTSIGKEALIAAAQVEEAMYNSYLNNRLMNAENNLFKSVNQLAKSKETNVSDIEVGPDGIATVRPAGLADLDLEDTIDLADRMQNLLIAQKKIARGEQNRLYNQVGEMDIAFFNEDGGFEQYPRFIRMLESEGILENSDVADDLKNLLDYSNKVKARLTPDGGLRDPVKVTLDAEGNAQNLTPTEDTQSTIPLNVLTTRRKEALAIARDGTKSAETRRIAGMFAEAIQDDIQNMEDFGADQINARQLQALRSANAFSRAFYDVYARSFVGDALQQTRQGDYKLALETIGQFNTARPNLNAVRIAQIENAGQFALDNNLDSAQAGVDSVHGVIDRLLRSARVEAYDPETKTINNDRLQEWMKKNARLEDTFPAIFEDLRNVQTQQALLQAEEGFETIAQKQAKSQTGFTTLLKDAKGQVRSNPTFAVAEAFSPGADQFSRLNELISVLPKKGETQTKQIYKVVNQNTGVEQVFFNRKEARDYAAKMGPDFKQTQETIRVNRELAIEGLKSSIFEYFVMGTPAGRGDARIEKPFNADVIYNNLFNRKFPTVVEKRAKARKGSRDMSVAEYLVSRGVFDKEDVKTAQTALTELAQAQMVDNVERLGIDLEQAKPILDFALGVSGSALGTRSQAMLTGGQGGPGSIIAAGKGAEAMRNIALRIPESQRMMFTAQLLQDPILLARMMRTYKADPKNQMGLLNSLKNYVEQKGFITLPMRTFTATRPSDQPDGDFDPRNTNQVPPNDQGASLNLPNPELSPAGNPTTQAQALSSATSGSLPPNQNVRTQYASLFPNDPISSMIQQQPRSFRRGGLASLLE